MRISVKNCVDSYIFHLNLILMHRPYYYVIDNFQAESCQIYVIRHKIFCSWLLNLTSAFVMEKCQLWTNFVIKVHFSPISSRFVWFFLTPA